MCFSNLEFLLVSGFYCQIRIETFGTMRLSETLKLAREFERVPSALHAKMRISKTDLASTMDYFGSEKLQDITHRI